MALSPVLIVGAGGSGGKTLRALRQTLLRRLRAKGWEGDIPEAWQFLEIDTISTQAREGFPADLLPAEDYMGLVPPQVNYAGLRNALLTRTPKNIHMGAFGGWLPESTPIRVQRGAGQYRTIGRAVAVTQLARIAAALGQSYSRMTAPGATAQLREVVQMLTGKADKVDDQPLAIIVSSVAGGSGAGIFIDIAEALKSINPGFEKTTHTFLYGPDVFSSVPIDMRDQIPANVLGAINEVVSGVWSSGLTDATAELYGSSRLVTRGEHGFGSRFNYIIGASNGTVTFPSQEQIYLSTGESLASLVSDDVIQDWFMNFVNVNVFVNSSNSVICDDYSRLKIDDEQWHTQPLGAIGVARVSLGMERFREYLAEGLASADVKRLLWPHFQPVDPTNPKTPNELISETVSYNWGSFLQETGLNERGESNQVIDALTPVDAEPRRKGFAQKALEFAQQGVEPAGLSNDQWVERLTNFFKLNQKNFETDDYAAVCKVAQTWVNEIQDRVIRAVSVSISRDGLFVTAEMLKRLRDEVQFVSKQELPTDAAKEIRKIDQLPSKLRESLPQGMSKIQAEAMRQEVQPKIIRAVNFIQDSQLMTVAAELLVDFEDNFLRELEIVVAGIGKKLQIIVDSDKDENGEENRFPSYADILSGVIPAQFKASEVERLLIDPSSYPTELEKLVKLSAPNSKQYWWDRVVERSILGTLIDERGDEQEPALIGLVANWSPTNSNFRSEGGSRKAIFSLPDHPEQYVLRNRDWLMDSTTALGKFLAQGLTDYLIHPDPAEQSVRRKGFSKAFESALDLAAPLCSINQTLLGQLHPAVTKKSQYLIQMSTIPFVEEGNLKDLFEISANLLKGKGLWDANIQRAFRLAGKVQSIDMFTCTPSAMNPMVFTSLMGDIARSWASASVNQAKAKGFWTNRRARPLMESLPVAGAVALEMVRGWFLAGLLDQRKIESTDQQGPKVSIWSPDHRGYINFPHPLLPMHNQTLVQNPEFLPAVLKALSLAMVECHTDSSLKPLEPYWRLRKLGSIDGYQQTISDWVRNGVLPEGAPTPNERLMGTASDNFETKKATLLNSLNRMKDDFKKRFEEVEKQADIFRVQRIYELAPYVMNSLNDFIEFTTSLEDVEGIVY